MYYFADPEPMNTSPSTAGDTPSISANTNNLEITATDKFTEADVNELMKLGFTRQQVIFELRHFNGDKNHATAALFAKSLKF